MKKNTFLITISAVAAFGLTGCPGGASNTNTTNANHTGATNANSNVAVVVNNNSNMTTNAMSNMSNAMTNTGTAGSGAGTEFMRDAAQGGMAEVKMGELAGSKAQNAEVKQFGQRMVTDHSKANDELKAVAAKKSVTLPTEVNAKQMEDMSKLQKLSGAEFDKEYVKMMVEDHEKDVADFQKQAETGTDADAKAFAAKTLPTLKEHLQMIKAIQGKMK